MVLRMVLQGVGWGAKNITALRAPRKEMFYLTTYSTHFTYGYMASDIW